MFSKKPFVKISEINFLNHGLIISLAVHMNCHSKSEIKPSLTKLRDRNKIDNVAMP